MTTTVQEKIVDVLSAASVTVYPLIVPKNGTYPCAVYQRISTVPVRSHDGVHAERQRLQVTVWGKRYADCVTTADTVKTELDLNQSDFMLATKESEFDVREVEPGLYRLILDFFVWD